MNGLIEKLAEQTDLLSELVPTKIPGLYSGYITEEQILRFAEEIVRECADYAEYQLQIGGTNADKIKQLFGVK